MLIVADVHGAFDALASVASRGEPLLVLGDLLNFVDYRTHEGMLATVAGKDVVARLAELRTSGDRDGARREWRAFSMGREDEIRSRYDTLILDAYGEMGRALSGSTAFVTYGNVDRPDVLRDHLPEGCRFVDGEVVEIEGVRVGFAGGGIASIGVPGEVTDAQMAEKLARVEGADVLCTHVAPAVAQLSGDTIGGRPKGSQAVLDHIVRMQPKHHFFGDIHQPQALTWRIGRTVCRNVGYFRATHRAVRFDPRGG